MRLRLPDPLATKWGRLATFFLLYVTEGIPLGFTATAIATQMRRQGLGPAEIGAFVGSLYLPWAFKWAVGPIVDTLAWDRLGRRRMWIVLAQIGMIATLGIALPVNFSVDVKLFTMLIIIHNIFGATQDVAIDALAVNVLKEDERGTANGFMFGGAYVGQAIGGSGVLYLTSVMPFRSTYLFVMGAIALVTLFVALPIREPKGEARPLHPNGPLAAIGKEIWTFIAEAVRSFLGSRSAFLGVFFAILPVGAYALGLALQSNLAVELGLNDNQVATLNLWSTVLSALCCIAGGYLSDRFGRKRTLALVLGATAIPTLWLAWTMQQAGWIHTIALDAPNRPVPSAALVWTFWATTLVYSVFNGLFYGIRSAQFMDITNPKVAATQFTAYMALMNFAISYTGRWQGWAIEKFGYPKTLLADALIGLPPLLFLLWMKPRSHEAAERELSPGAPVEGVAP
jgi:PAT family beta-lactamase induction signal transducer AmpG